MFATNQINILFKNSRIPPCLGKKLTVGSLEMQYKRDGNTTSYNKQGMDYEKRIWSELKEPVKGVKANSSKFYSLIPWITPKTERPAFINGWV